MERPEQHSMVISNSHKFISHPLRNVSRLGFEPRNSGTQSRLLASSFIPKTMLRQDASSKC